MINQLASGELLIPESYDKSLEFVSADYVTQSNGLLLGHNFPSLIYHIFLTFPSNDVMQ